MCFFGEFAFSTFLYFELELLIVIQPYFIVSNCFLAFENNLLPLL